MEIDEQAKGGEDGQQPNEEEGFLISILTTRRNDQRVNRPQEPSLTHLDLDPQALAVEAVLVAAPLAVHGVVAREEGLVGPAPGVGGRGPRPWRSPGLGP